MSRQAKIIIFSLILLFSIYQKQTSNDVSVSNINSKVDKKPVERIYDDSETKEAKKDVKGMDDDLGTEKNPLKWFPTPENGFSPYDQYFGKGIYNNNSGLWISLGLLVGFILEFVIKNNFNKSEKEQ